MSCFFLFQTLHITRLLNRGERVVQYKICCYRGTTQTAMPPSQATQYINRILHKEPLASIFHTFFWAIILLFFCPVAGFFLLLSSPARILYAILNDHRRINAFQDGMEFCVVVSGCDSGFGKDVAFELSRRGFVVFAGCRSLDESGHQFEGEYPGEHISYLFKESIAK